MRTRIARRRRPTFTERLIQEPPTIVRDARRLLHRGAEADEFAREVVERRLDLAPQRAAMVREEQISGSASDDRTHESGRNGPRVVHRPSYSAQVFTNCVPCPTARRLSISASVREPFA